MLNVLSIPIFIIWISLTLEVGTIVIPVLIVIPSFVIDIAIVLFLRNGGEGDFFAVRDSSLIDGVGTNVVGRLGSEVVDDGRELSLCGTTDAMVADGWRAMGCDDETRLAERAITS